MHHPENAMERYLRESGENISSFAAKINRSPSTLTRVLNGERNPSFDLARSIEKGTKGRVSAAEFLAICMSAGPKASREKVG